MGCLIDDLLKLSRLSRVEMQRESVDLTSMAHAIAGRLREAEPTRNMEFVIQEGLIAGGDAHLLEIVLANLLSNAAKFTGPRPVARIEFGQNKLNGRTGILCARQRRGFRHGVRRKFIRCISTPPQAHRVSGNRDRLGHSAARVAPAWRQDLGLRPSAVRARHFISLSAPLFYGTGTLPLNISPIRSYIFFPEC